MADPRTVHAIGASLVRHLGFAYPRAEDAGPDHIACSFDLLGTGTIGQFAPDTTTVTLLLHRIALDPHLRNQIPGERPRHGGRRPLTLELHYLVTAWGESAEIEQTVLAWTMQALHECPVLDRSLLVPRALWQDEDEIHFLPVEMALEDMTRLWDTLGVAYRLSAPYLARVVRLGRLRPQSGRPVVARRLDLHQPLVEPADG